MLGLCERKDIEKRCECPSGRCGARREYSLFELQVGEGVDGFGGVHVSVDEFEVDNVGDDLLAGGNVVTFAFFGKLGENC